MLNGAPRGHLRGQCTVRTAKPLQIAGKTQHLGLQWGEARGRACFIVIVGLKSPPCLISIDIMRPLHVHIDVTNGTATPAQPDPQTVHLNAAQSQQQRKEMSLPGAGLRSSRTADPPPTQPQRRENLLPRSWLSDPGKPPLCRKFHSSRRKCRCRELNSHLWEPLILSQIQSQRRGNAVAWSWDISPFNCGDPLPIHRSASRSTINCPTMHRHSSHR